MRRIVNSLSFRRNISMILQDNSVKEHCVLLCPSNVQQRLSVIVVIMSSLEYGWISSMLGLSSFLQHFLSLVVHSLSFRRSMIDTATVVLFNNIARN